MAKAKKPGSRNKSNRQTPKADAVKPEGAGSADPKTTDTTAGAKTSEAAAAKPDAKVTAEGKLAAAAKDAKAAEVTEPTVPVSKPADVKPPVDAKLDAKPPADAKQVTDAKPQTGATPPPAAKPDVAKPAQTTSAIKAAETKTASASGAAAKPSDVKAPAKTDTKSSQTATKSGQTASGTKTPPPPASTPKPQPAPEPEKARGGFVPLVLGGLVAGGIGFAAAELNFLGTRSDTDGIRETLTQQEERLAIQQGEIETLAAIEAIDLTGLETQLGGVEGQIIGVTDTATALETRLTELENRPIPIADDGGISTEYIESLVAEYAQKEAVEQSAAYEAELATLQAAVEEQKAAVEAQKAEVEEQNVEIARLLENAQSVEEATSNAAREATIQAGAAKLVAALSSGEPYNAVIDDLSDAGITDLPAALTDQAADGVPTLQTLQGDFPATARAALGAARSSGVDAGTGGVGGFLKRQLGARSVAPRDGDDPDAVLSRAEAAVRGGDVDTALTELDTLPAEVQSAMDDWMAQARTRAGAEQAVQDLSERLTAN